MDHKLTKFVMVFIPAPLIWFSWCMKLYWLTVIAIISMYFFIGICEYCDKHENVWIFVNVGIASIPVNFECSLFACRMLSDIWNSSLLLNILLFILIYDICLSAEEIVLGIIGRIIWREQRPFIESGFEFDVYKLLSEYKTHYH